MLYILLKVDSFVLEYKILLIFPLKNYNEFYDLFNFVSKLSYNIISVKFIVFVALKPTDILSNSLKRIYVVVYYVPLLILFLI